MQTSQEHFTIAVNAKLGRQTEWVKLAQVGLKEDDRV